MRKNDAHPCKEGTQKRQYIGPETPSPVIPLLWIVVDDQNL